LILQLLLVGGDSFVHLSCEAFRVVVRTFAEARLVTAAVAGSVAEGEAIRVSAVLGFAELRHLSNLDVLHAANVRVFVHGSSEAFRIVECTFAEARLVGTAIICCVTEGETIRMCTVLVFTEHGVGAEIHCTFFRFSDWIV
jgi:hypothetical protein